MNKTIILILIIGTSLRLIGLGSNISYGGIYHPDTPKQIQAAWDFINGNYYIPHMHPDFRGYPMFTMHIVEWVFRLARGLHFLVAFLFGMHHGIDNSNFNILYIYLLARSVLVVFSVLTIYLIYKMGSRLFNQKVGILASLLFSLSPLSSSLCHYSMGDTAMVFFAVVATYFSSMIIIKGDPRYYFLAGLFTMFSFSSKYNGIIVGILPIVALLYKRKKILISTSLLLSGTIIGLFIGNPHLFRHLKEGIVDILYFLKYTSNFGLSSEELAIPRISITRTHLLENINMLIGSLQLPVFILVVFASLYIITRPKFRYIFISLFPIVYLGLSFYGKPSLQPLYLLAIFPCLFILIGISLVYLTKIFKFPLYGLYIFSVLMYGYNSFTEDYFFWHKDTRQFAEEWVKHNIPPNSNIQTTGYSISNPHEKHIGPSLANFFVSSSLSGMYMPSEAIVIKEFSLENKIPPTIHRNPDIKISVIPGKGFKKEFWMPKFGKPIINWPDPIFIFLNGIELGPSKESIMLKRKERRSITYVSNSPLKNIVVAITSGNSKAKVKVVVTGKKRLLKLKPNETKSIAFKNPRPGFPHTKYFYKMSIKNITGNEVLFQLATEKDKPLYPLPKVRSKKEFYKVTGINPDILGIVNTQTFEAEEMMYGDNEIIRDKLYSNDHAIMLKPEEGKNLIWGPYQFYTKGNYIANFSISSDSETSTRLEVVANGGKTILAEKELMVSGSKEILLPFEIKEPAAVLEFRVIPTGTNPILVDKIDIYPDLLPLVHRVGGHLVSTYAVDKRLNRLL